MHFKIGPHFVSTTQFSEYYNLKFYILLTHYRGNKHFPCLSGLPRCVGRMKIYKHQAHLKWNQEARREISHTCHSVHTIDCIRKIFKLSVTGSETILLPQQEE